MRKPNAKKSSLIVLVLAAFALGTYLYLGQTGPKPTESSDSSEITNLNKAPALKGEKHSKENALICGEHCWQVSGSAGAHERCQAQADNCDPASEIDCASSARAERYGNCREHFNAAHLECLERYCPENLDYGDTETIMDSGETDADFLENAAPPSGEHR